MSEMHADLKAAQQRILALKHNLLELEEAGKRTAERLIHVERRLSDANGEVLRLGLQLKHHLQLQAERDALAAKLAELEGQGPVGEIIHSAAGPSQDGAYRHVLLSRARLENQPLFARPIPPEQPVNARLLAAARAVVARWETPTWKDAPATAGFIYELRDAIAACAESAPKAVRLTAPDIVDALRANGMYADSRAFQRFFPTLEADARAIETAVLRKNGIEVAE